MEGVVGVGEAGYVGDVFAKGLFAVYVEVGKGCVGVVLGGECGGDGVEVSEVFGVHQLRTRPMESKAAPSESKVWLISWPMMVPMAP